MLLLSPQSFAHLTDVYQIDSFWRHTHLDVHAAEWFENPQVINDEIKKPCARCQTRVGDRQHQSRKASRRERLCNPQRQYDKELVRYVEEVIRSQQNEQVSGSYSVVTIS